MKACGDQLLWMCARSRGVKIEYREGQRPKEQEIRGGRGLEL